MPPQTTSLLTTAMLLLAGVAALLILEAQGRPKAAKQVKPLTWAHRAGGLVFALMFALLSAVMIARDGGYQTEFSPRITWHIVLAVALAVLLAFKILIARRYRKHYAYLPVLGGLLLTGTVVLAALTAGNYYLHRDRIAATETAPEALTRQKCSRCHTMQRVFEKRRSAEQWGAVIDQMVENSEEIGEYDFLSTAEKQILIDYLAGRP